MEAKHNDRIMARQAKLKGVMDKQESGATDRFDASKFKVVKDD